MTRSRNTGDLLAPTGTVLSTKVSYSATSNISRSLESKLSDWVSVEDYGAIGDGTTNDGPALNAAFSAAGDSGVSLMFTKGKTYATEDRLQIPANLFVLGNGCTILLNRTDTSNSTQINIGSNCTIQDISVVLGSSYIIERGVSVGENSTLFRCSFVSTDQNPPGNDNLDGFLQLRSNNVRVSGCKFVNWDKPIFATECDQVWVTDCYFESYLRGIGLRDVESFFITGCEFNLKSPNATTDPGHNAIGGSGANILVDGVTVYEAGEHGIYFAEQDLSKNRSVTITNVKLDQMGQCGIKIRGFDRVTIGNIQVVDCAYNNTTGTNEDGLRLESCTNVLVNGYRVSRKNKGAACFDGIHLAGCENVSIYSFYVDRPVRAGILIQDDPLNLVAAGANVFCHNITVLNSVDAGIAIGTASLSTSRVLSGVTFSGLNIINPGNSAVFINHSGPVTGLISFGGSVHSSLVQLVNNVLGTIGLTFDLSNSNVNGEPGLNDVRRKSFYAETVRPGDGTPLWTSGSGTPNGAVAAPVGSLFTRTDGGSSTVLYVKETGTGNTGWVAK